MKIKYFCSLWGMHHATLEANLREIKAAGFAGVEMAVPSEASQRRQMQMLLAELSLELVALLASSGATPQEHTASLAWQLDFANECKPALVNSHSGQDFFAVKENVRIIKQTNKLAAKLGLPIVHETHRRHALYSVPDAIAMLDAIPDLRINADLAHLLMVHDSYLQNQLASLKRVLERCYYIHARVGHPAGGQVSDPRAPEWQQAVDYHIGWWQQIVDARIGEDAPEMIICTEFGPPHYLPTLPYTRQPVADLWEINRWMCQTLQARIRVDPPDKIDRGSTGQDGKAICL